MPTASATDTARVLSTVLLPVLARGVILRRPRVVALSERLDADRRAGRLLRQLRAKYGPEPLRLRIPGRPVAIVLSPEDLRSVLLGSPEPYALANREKVATLAHFEPHGVLVSHGAIRAQRRRFNEAVLDTGKPVHRLTDSITATIEAQAQLPERVTWETFGAMWWRIVREVVLGPGARDDTTLIEQLNALRSDANWAYLRPKRTRLRQRFEERLRHHLARAEPGSLAALVAATPSGADVDPAGQVPQWLFAFDAAGIAAYRALALLSAQPDSAERDREYLQAAVLDSVRLWPTTMVILRETTRPVGEHPAGSAFVIINSYFQRDPALPYADRFAPEIWRDGRAQDNWSLVPFSAGPGACPGRDIVLQMTSTLLATLLDRYRFRLVRKHPLNPAGPLPSVLDHTGLRFAVRARERERVSGPAGITPPVVPGSS